MTAKREHELIFRWSLWEPDPDKVFMLSHSIGTFRAFFGSEARYAVCTDRPDFMEHHLLVPAELVPFSTHTDAVYLDSRITWRKWAPRPRLNVDAIEVRLDADIFLVAEPTELRAFCSLDSSHRLLATMEEFEALWPYGNFGDIMPAGFTPINAGVIGQHRGVDFSQELDELYVAWASMIQERDYKYHDEQGAIAFLLQDKIRRGEVLLLDPLRYRVVCPLNDPPVESLEDLCLIHATYPDHPAFYHFIEHIARVSGLPSERPSWKCR